MSNLHERVKQLEKEMNPPNFLDEHPQFKDWFIERYGEEKTSQMSSEEMIEEVRKRTVELMEENGG
jgi:hypothetical protein